MKGLWFSGWEPIVRTFVVGTLTYVALILMLRITGKRTLSKMNAFDLVVTVALGSVFASALTNRNVALSQGVTAVMLLVLLQFVVTWVSVRWRRFQKLIKADPSLVVKNGQLIESVARRERLTHEEVLAAVRSQGYERIEDVDAVVLETDGSFSVLKQAPRIVADPAKNL